MARGPARRPRAGRGATRAQPIPFVYKLVLNQWLLSLFNVKKLEDLAGLLKNEGLEGLDENNIHHFHHALTAQLFNLTQLPTELLLEYDQNIVKHTLRLNDRRITRGEAPIVWKYFQYLTLLFTEIYLDRYFRDPQGLLASLNEQIAKYNEGKPEGDQLAPLDTAKDAWSQLNKVAYWSATGSGKTLVMHTNILQYQFYLDKHGRRRELNRILLLTPNEGLSRQHRREFETAGISAELFNKDAPGLFVGHSVEILDIHKLKDEMGDKTIAVEAFEGNNLVLVDEGHRGASSGEEGTWMKFRDQLCEKGFSFEYSATFGQAVKNSKPLTERYAKSILFDYSYRYFYEDGFGKDYQILNLDEGTEQLHRDLYLVACLLSFYQQQRLYREHASAFRPYNVEKPLWIFVGGSVVKGLAAKDASDIVEILKFLAGYVRERNESIQRIDRILKQGIETATGKNLFHGRFAHLNLSGLSATQIFEDSLATLFNAPGGGHLYIENLKGATGEIALRLGADNDPFGVINVGDDAKLVKLCEEHGLDTGEREFGGSLFHDINQPHSKVNLLIGSKKFTEGWSSWRVSTMGLMNVGRGEGAQIIQLFGRGVRLKGYNLSLKRSSRVSLPEGIQSPKPLRELETLGIFGIRADYMAQFRDYLFEEGLPSNEDRIEIILPIIKNLGTQSLKMVRLKKTINGVSTEFGNAFRRLGPVPTLAKPAPAKEPSTEYLVRNQVVLNWYPKIQAMHSDGANTETDAAPNETCLRPEHVAFLNYDRLFFDLERYKAERGWYNLNLTHGAIEALLADPNWYRLQIPEVELAFDNFEKVRLWQEIALALLKKYTERYYLFRKREWELPHLEYQDLTESDPNFSGVGESPEEGYYRVLIDRSQEEIVAKLEELKTQILKGDMKPWEFRGMKALWFGQHLFQPLLYVDSNVVELQPVSLNKGEKQFVEDLKHFHDHDEGFFKGKELYLLRNQSKGKGVGFFEAGNFHPDFILWLVAGGMQHVVFVDPKGIRNLGATDPKLNFYRTVKDIETRLNDPSVKLHSFIVSNTPAATMQMLWKLSKPEMLARNIVFQEEDKGTYVSTILRSVMHADR